MKIAMLAPPYLPVPPQGYGGTERIIHYLTEGLVKKGHEVTLFASGDSKTAAQLSYTFKEALGNSGEIKNKPLLPFLHYIDCFSKAEFFDIIHNHAQYYAMFLADLIDVPVVHTIHGSFAQGEVPEDKRMTLKRFANHNFISISNNQRESLPELNYVGTVYNGTNIKNYPFFEQRGDYLLWVGRITRKKGALESIAVARKLGMKLKLVGVVDPIDRPYFESEVNPLIDGKQIELIGELNGTEKAKMYGQALCTLYPITWHEPFGLVMTESMACGTPVVAFHYGSVPEIIEEGKTGFIVSDVEEMAGAVKKIERIKRSDCRERVEKNFSIEKMVDGYEEVYKKILN